MPQHARNALARSSPPDHSSLQKTTLLLKAHVWAREESPLRLDAKAGLQRRAGACPKSPISLPLTLQERLRFKWDRAQADFPGIERKTIFQVDDQTRYRYDTMLGKVPVD